MSLSANVKLRSKLPPQRHKVKIVDGAIHIYEGALLAYEAGNIGYAKLAADELTSEFCGISTEEVNLAAADNTTNGTFEVEVIPRGSGEWVELNVRSNITIANEGDPVYMDGDDYVDIASGIVSSVTGGLVGIIREFISTNKAWVQLTQHPIL